MFSDVRCADARYPDAPCADRFGDDPFVYLRGRAVAMFLTAALCLLQVSLRHWAVQAAAPGRPSVSTHPSEDTEPAGGGSILLGAGQLCRTRGAGEGTWNMDTGHGTLDTRRVAGAHGVMWTLDTHRWKFLQPGPRTSLGGWGRAPCIVFHLQGNQVEETLHLKNIVAYRH